MNNSRYIIKADNMEFYLDIELRKKEYTDSIVQMLIEERKRLGLTQQDVADLSGMKAPNVTRIESKKYSPSLDVLMRYARVVGKEINLTLVDIEDKEING